MSAYALNLDALGGLDEAHFVQLCRDNPDLKLERTAGGELIVMAPTGGETGRFNAEILADLVNWNRRTDLGFCFDSSTGFHLPNGADRSPDVAWVEKSRWLALSPQQRERFAPIAPDFVVELRSPSDDLSALQAKLREYLDSGVRLVWLLDRPGRRVEIHRPGQTVEITSAPVVLSGEAVLPGFSLRFE